MPGVLMLEALAQAAAILALESAGIEIDDKTLVYFAAIDHARFKRPVEPGDQLRLEVTLLKLRQGVQRFAAQARVGDELAVEAEMMCAIRRTP
jgi:3-hydroxyacyl-[acyl-carrier-protein] dehydratase